jgi:hypothetical protein
VSDDVVRPATNEEFAEAYGAAQDAVRERAPLTAEEKAAGWEEDWSGIRVNDRTGEVDDSLFFSYSPRMMYDPKYNPKLRKRGRRE